jgi:UDPglucose 6-dehydrogenase
MASIGHEVIGVDIDDCKVSLLNSGRGWFHEPELDSMLAENIKASRLRFTSDFAEAGKFASVHFLGVATPGSEDGSYDLSQLHAALSSLVPHLRGDCLIIGKSTVAPGTAAKLQAKIESMLEQDHGRAEVVWIPEFLREGYAVEDTLRPNRIVVGAASAGAVEIMREVYRPLTDAGVTMVVTDLATSELAKGAANAFLATKISFINAMADICTATGSDISDLTYALGLDPRIGKAYLGAGIGYGGACLPKDVRGLRAFAEQLGAGNASLLLSAVEEVNASRIDQVVQLVREVSSGIKGKRVAVWGVTFKPGTDDVRDSAGLQVAERLRSLDATVTVYDPMGRGNALVACPELIYADTAITAAANADVILVVTAWPEFARLDPAEVAEVVRSKAVVDACQGLSSCAWRDAGWHVSSLTGVDTGQSQHNPPQGVAYGAHDIEDGHGVAQLADEAYRLDECLPDYEGHQECPPCMPVYTTAACRVSHGSEQAKQAQHEQHARKTA